MNQCNIGNYIANKRKQKNLTQEQLANILGVSNKTISKWENGRCMPDYSIIDKLCKELDITIAELLDGEDKDTNSIRVYDEEQIKSLLKKVEDVENSYKINIGLILIVLGLLSLAIFPLYGGTHVKEFISGALFGGSLSLIFLGMIVIIVFKRGKKNER